MWHSVSFEEDFVGRHLATFLGVSLSFEVSLFALGLDGVHTFPEDPRQSTAAIARSDQCFWIPPGAEESYGLELQEVELGDDDTVSAFAPPSSPSPGIERDLSPFRLASGHMGGPLGAVDVGERRGSQTGEVGLAGACNDLSASGDFPFPLVYTIDAPRGKPAVSELHDCGRRAHCGPAPTASVPRAFCLALQVCFHRESPRRLFNQWARAYNHLPLPGRCFKVGSLSSLGSPPATFLAGHRPHTLSQPVRPVGGTALDHGPASAAAMPPCRCDGFLPPADHAEPASLLPVAACAPVGLHGNAQAAPFSSQNSRPSGWKFYGNANGACSKARYSSTCP